MSAQHTPGPWLPSQILDDGRWGIVTAQNEIVVGATQALVIENARLIAAAPDHRARDMKPTDLSNLRPGRRMFTTTEPRERMWQDIVLAVILLIVLCAAPFLE